MDTESENNEEVQFDDDNPELWERVLMLLGVIGFSKERDWIETEREKIWMQIEELSPDTAEIPATIIDAISNLMNRAIEEVKIPEIEEIVNLVPNTNEDFQLIRSRIALFLLAHFEICDGDTVSQKSIIEEFTQFMKEEFVGFKEDFDSAYENFDLSLNEKEDYFLSNFFPERYEDDEEDEDDEAS